MRKIAEGIYQVEEGGGREGERKQKSGEEEGLGQSEVIYRNHELTAVLWCAPCLPSPGFSVPHHYSITYEDTEAQKGQ